MDRMRKRGQIAGYAYLDLFGVRKGYRYTCDLSIYLDAARRGRGAGTLLYREIKRRARALGLRDVISGGERRERRFPRGDGLPVCRPAPRVAEKFGRRFGVFYMQKTLDEA